MKVTITYKNWLGKKQTKEFSSPILNNLVQDSGYLFREINAWLLNTDATVTRVSYS
jgi:hypothetical protein